MLPFHNTDLKKKKNHGTADQVLSATCKVIFKKNKVIALQTHYFLRFAGCLQKKKKVITLCQTSPLDKKNKQKNAEIKCHFALLKLKNARIKHQFAFVKSLCENAGKYFALFCAYWEHCWQPP